MPIPSDFLTGAYNGLSAVNVAAYMGFNDAAWAANSTVTAVIAAILLLPLGAGWSDDMKQKVAVGIRNGQLSGAMPETHGVTTVAGARALFTAQLPGVDATFTGALPQ